LLGEHNLQSLREKLESYEKIFVTGVSGWLGRETVHLLNKTVQKDFRQRVTLFASERKSLEIRGEEFQVLPLRDIEVQGKANLIIHFAYLNQGKAHEHGLDDFIAYNREITETISKYLTKYPGTALLMASSGAAVSYRRDINSRNPMEVYASLKSESEEIFLKHGSLSEAVIMRIWNVTGSIPPRENIYAIQDFLNQAQVTGFINITGHPESKRSFIDIQEMMFLYIMELEQKVKKVLDSGGFTTSLQNLAEIVLSECSKPPENIKIHPSNQEPSIYISKSFTLNDTANKYKLDLASLSQQVRNLMAVSPSN
jgi:nucleoside-diphosphate-sugar epimerase